MIQLKSPYIIIVSGTQTGNVTSVSFQTQREIERSVALDGDTIRDIHYEHSINVDTLRYVHNANNLDFDTIRKLNNDTNTNNDTYRIVSSDNDAEYHSAFIHDLHKAPIECVLFSGTDLFPYPDKYITVMIDDTEKIKYIPLVPVGSSVYDSGMRYTDDNGIEWQACSGIVVDIIHERFVADNYYVNMDSFDYVYDALRKIFDGRITKDENNIYLHAPSVSSGITKMFMIGLNIKISWLSKNNRITLGTYENGINHTSYGGDEKYKSNAMLVEFEPQYDYTISFTDEYKHVKYNKEKIKNCLIFGKDIEKLKSQSESYQSLLNTESYSTFYNNSIIPNEGVYLKQVLDYPHSGKMYSFFKAK